MKIHGVYMYLYFIIFIISGLFFFRRPCLFLEGLFTDGAVTVRYGKQSTQGRWKTARNHCKVACV